MCRPQHFELRSFNEEVCHKPQPRLFIMAKRKSLKATLNSHQVRMFKNKQAKAKESQKMAVKKVDARPKGKPIVPYSTSDSILLVGGGLLQFIAV
jgi:hypothetical protein